MVQPTNTQTIPTNNNPADKQTRPAAAESQGADDCQALSQQRLQDRNRHGVADEGTSLVPAEPAKVNFSRTEALQSCHFTVVELALQARAVEVASLGPRLCDARAVVHVKWAELAWPTGAHVNDGPSPSRINVRLTHHALRVVDVLDVGRRQRCGRRIVVPAVLEQELTQPRLWDWRRKLEGPGRHVCLDSHDIDTRPALRHPKVIRIEELAADMILWLALVILHVKQCSFDADVSAFVRGIEETGDILNDEEIRPNIIDGFHDVI